MVKVIDCSIKINACRITLRSNQGTPQNGLLNFLLTVSEILLERLTIVHAFQAIFCKGFSVFKSLFPICGCKQKNVFCVKWEGGRPTFASRNDQGEHMKMKIYHR